MVGRHVAYLLVSVASDRALIAIAQRHWLRMKDEIMPNRSSKPQRLAREWPAELQVAATNGNHLIDSRGKKYIDFVMGWCVGNFGWQPPAIAKAIERFKGPDYIYPGYAYRRGRSWPGCSRRWPRVH